MINVRERVTNVDSNERRRSAKLLVAGLVSAGLLGSLLVALNAPDNMGNYALGEDPGELDTDSRQEPEPEVIDDAVEGTPEMEGLSEQPVTNTVRPQESGSQAAAPPVATTRTVEWVEVLPAPERDENDERPGRHVHVVRSGEGLAIAGRIFVPDEGDPELLEAAVAGADTGAHVLVPGD